ncbi:MAG: tyrosine-type recombinase/integrase [Chitinophagaceae bacterium]
MLLPIKAICGSKRVRKDATSIIFIQYCYTSENRVLLNTEIAIPPEFWDKKKLCISNDLPHEYGDALLLNYKLKTMIRNVEDLIVYTAEKLITDRLNFIKQVFKPDFDMTIFLQEAKTEKLNADKKDVRINLDIYFQIEDYIKFKEKKVNKATICVYNCMKEQLKAFEEFRNEKITFQSFDYSFYEAFIDFLTFDYIQRRRKKIIKGLKLNSIGKTIKQLRIFIRDRVRRKIISPIDLSDFKIPEEEGDAIYLTYEEIGKIYRTDLTAFHYLIEYRDLFILACLTGLRFSDFSMLEAEDLQKDMLYKKQEKSDHWVVVPLRKEAKEIFLKQFKNKLPQFTNSEFNRHIKTIGRLAGIDQRIKFSYKKANKTIEIIKSKYDWITTHTARRSFCTNEFLAGTPVKLIMKIIGHKNEKDFYKYIRVTPEEAAQKIKELWKERNEMEPSELN